MGFMDSRRKNKTHLIFTTNKLFSSIRTPIVLSEDSEKLLFGLSVCFD